MKPFLLASLILLSGGAAWAQMKFQYLKPETYYMDGSTIPEDTLVSADVVQEAQERERRSAPYEWTGSTNMTDGQMFPRERERRSEPYIKSVEIYKDVTVAISTNTSIWIVTKGSETYTLDEFVSSGKFCKVYGHKWPNFFSYSSSDSCQNERCLICRKCRTRIKTKKEVEEFEP